MTREDDIHIPASGIPTLGVNAKLNRGREHLETFVKEGRVFVEGATFSIEPSYSDDYREFEFRIRLTQLPDVLRWGLLIGDCLNNFRSALDYSVYAIAVQSTGSDPPAGWRGLQFPIVPTKERFEAEVGRGRLRGLPEPAKELIESTQPFEGRPQHLARLQELNNTDKHRLMHLVAGIPAESTIEVKHAGELQHAVMAVDAPITDGSLLARFVFREPSPSATFSPKVGVLYGFPDEPRPRRGATQELAGIYDGVNEAIHMLRPFMPALDY